VQSLQHKFIIMCPETVFRYLPMSGNLPKLSLNVPNRHKIELVKRPNFIWCFFKNDKKLKDLNKVKNYKFSLKKAKLVTLHESFTSSENRQTKNAVRVSYHVTQQ